MVARPVRARGADDTAGAVHYDPPFVIDLRDVLGQCDWRGCSNETVALRWEGAYLGEYLAVCIKHRSPQHQPEGGTA